MEFALVEGKERNAIVDLSRMEARYIRNQKPK